MASVADKTIKILLHPEWAVSFKNLVRLGCRVRAPRVKNLGERPAFGDANDGVNVVGHDAESDEIIAFAIEMAQGVDYDFCYARIAKETRTVPGIFVSIDPRAQFDAFRRVRGASLVDGKLPFPTGEHVGGQGIKQSERNGLQPAILAMRNIVP